MIEEKFTVDSPVLQKMRGEKGEKEVGKTV